MALYGLVFYVHPQRMLLIYGHARQQHCTYVLINKTHTHTHTFWLQTNHKRADDK